MKIITKQYIKGSDGFDNKYFNSDKKRIIKKPLTLASEKEINNFSRFLFAKKTVGFWIGYSLENVKRIAVFLKNKKQINVNDEIVKDQNKLVIDNNYIALQWLLYIYKEKMDIIYIGLPYNTIRSLFKRSQTSKKKIEKNNLIYKNKFERNGD